MISPGIPKKPVSNIDHHSTIIPKPKRLHKYKIIPPIKELIINFIIILNGKDINFKIAIKTITAIKKYNIFIFSLY